MEILSKLQGPDGKGMKLMFQPGDAKNFLKWGAAGFVGLGLYQMFVTMSQRNINPCVDLKDKTECFNMDPIIRDGFIKLQGYRELNPWLFQRAVHNVDQLLFLEYVLVGQSVVPCSDDKVLGWTFFRVSVNTVHEFLFLIRESVGNEHAAAASMVVDKIYKQLQKHITNVLQLCRKFNPEKLLARAPMEVQRAVEQYKKGKKPENSWRKWEKLRHKLEKKKQKQQQQQDQQQDRTSDASRKSSRRASRK